MSLANALSFSLKWEGGYSNDPVDPGGATYKGVIQRTYDAYRDSKKLPRQDVRKLAQNELEDLYKTRYYDACGCDKLPEHMEVVVLDTAINMGPGVAKDFLAKSGNDMYKYLQLRIARYDDIIRRNPSQVKFKNGWNNRVTDLRRFAEALKTNPTSETKA